MHPESVFIHQFEIPFLFFNEKKYISLKYISLVYPDIEYYTVVDYFLSNKKLFSPSIDFIFTYDVKKQDLDCFWNIVLSLTRYKILPKDDILASIPLLSLSGFVKLVFQMQLDTGISYDIVDKYFR